ncbi:hypothetical protein HKD37_09G024954 [Glycine soja]
MQCKECKVDNSYLHFTQFNKMHTQSFTIPQFFKIGLTHKKVPSGVANCRNMPFRGRAKARLTGALSKGGKMHGVATNVYLWKTSGKPKETGRQKRGSCSYVPSIKEEIRPT